MDKKVFGVLIIHCFLMGKNTVEAKQWLDKLYGDSTPGKAPIIDWYAKIKRDIRRQCVYNFARIFGDA